MLLLELKILFGNINGGKQMISAEKMKKITEENGIKEINRVMSFIESEMKKCKIPKLQITFHDLQIYNENIIKLIEKELVDYGYNVERKTIYFDISW